VRFIIDITASDDAPDAITIADNLLDMLCNSECDVEGIDSFDSVDPVRE
jgi:hypothetical protein